MKIGPVEISLRKKRVPQPKVVRTVTSRHARGLDMAKVDNLLADWNSTSLSSDAELRKSLSRARSRSRELWMNNDYAVRFGTLLKTHVIGPTGIALQNKAKDTNGKLDKTANDTIETGWRKFGKKGMFDVTGMLSILDAEKLFIETVARDGEILYRLVRNFDNAFGFAIQFLEPDHLDEKLNRKLANGNEIRLGVEYNGWDRPVAFWLFKKHPGDYGTVSYGAQKHQRILADEVRHAFVPGRIRQGRGIPWVHSAAIRMHMLGGYEEAALVNARHGASKMATIETEVPEGMEWDGVDEKGNSISEVSPGLVEELPMGKKLVPYDPKYPDGEIAVFVKCMLQGIASGLGPSYFKLSNDHSGFNYSSGRLVELDERDHWRMLQRWVCENFMQPVFEAWLEMAILSGEVKLPMSKFDKFSAATWRCRGWDWVDPIKEQKANSEAMKNKSKSLTRILSERGIDLEDHLDELKLERELAAERGIDLDEAATKTKATPDAGGDTATDSDEVDHQKLRTLADTYAIAVRAGLITPQATDEEWLRGLVELPEVSAEVTEAWETDGGVRRPITLQSGKAFDAEQENLEGETEDDDEV